MIKSEEKLKKLEQAEKEKLELKKVYERLERKRVRDHEASQKWLHTHARKCPGCKSPVEKNGGCETMHCRCGRVGNQLNLLAQFYC